jgi:hypothetical protein
MLFSLQIPCHFHFPMCSIKWHLSIPFPMQRISAHTFNQSIMPITLPDDVPIGLVITQHWKVPNLASNFPHRVACCVAQLSIFAHATISTCFMQRSVPIALPDDVPISLVIIQFWKVPNLASNSSPSSESCHWIAFDHSNPIQFASAAPHCSTPITISVFCHAPKSE